MTQQYDDWCGYTSYTMTYFGERDQKMCHFRQNMSCVSQRDSSGIIAAHAQAPSSRPPRRPCGPTNKPSQCSKPRRSRTAVTLRKRSRRNDLILYHRSTLLLVLCCVALELYRAFITAVLQEVCVSLALYDTIRYESMEFVQHACFLQ